MTADVLKTMNDWSNNRIQELRKWRLHHEACIKEIDEDILRLQKTHTDYEEFIKKVRGVTNAKENQG